MASRRPTKRLSGRPESNGRDSESMEASRSSWTPPLVQPTKPTEHYENLKGSTGAAVAYRAERHLVKKLLAQDGGMHLDSAELQAEVHDFSFRGVALWVPKGTSVPSKLEATIHACGKVIYEGRAKLVHREGYGEHDRVGLELLSGTLDLVQVRKIQADYRLDQDLTTNWVTQQALIPPAYRDVVGRFAAALQSFRSRVEAYEARYRDLGEALPDVREKLYTSFKPQWTELRDEAAEQSVEFFSDDKVLEAAKRYTEALLTVQLLSGDNLRRAYLKPLGYPGDFELMAMLMRNGFEGKDTLGSIYHRFMGEEPLAEGVRQRRAYLANVTIEQLRAHKARQGKLPFRVTSLACGPASEVVDVIKHPQFNEGDIVWTLIDQEERALARAYHDANLAFQQRGFQPSLWCKNLSFNQMLRDPSLAIQGIPQHLIYASGLYDYLRNKTAQHLTKNLFKFTNKHGCLVIGNVDESVKDLWLTECVADWSLVPRTSDEVKSFSVKADERYSVEISKSLNFHMLHVTRY